MLDLSAVKNQIDAMVEEERAVQENFQEKLALAQREHQRWSRDWEYLADKIAGSKTSWLLPVISEPIGRCYAAPPRPRQPVHKALRRDPPRH